MENRGMTLAWIVVKDFEKGVQFYTEVLGLELISRADEYKWAELKGKDGAAIGIMEYSDPSPINAGENAVLTYSVSDIEKACDQLKEKGVNLLGEIQEVPGHVKLQLFKDLDGNLGQLAQKLDN